MNTASRPAILPEDPFLSVATLIRAGKWDEGRAAARAIVAQGLEPGGDVALLLVVAGVRAGASDLSMITPELVRGGDMADLRRLLISPLIQQGALADAVLVLGVAIEACPTALEIRRQRAGLLARLRQWDAAIEDMDAVAVAAPADVASQGARLQYRLAAGRVDEAAAMAAAFDAPPADERLFNFALVALIRAKRFDVAADLAARADTDRIDDPALAGNIVQAMFRAGRHDEAIAAGTRFLEWLLDGPILRSHLGQAWLESGPMDERFARAIEHFEAGVAQAPEDVRMVSLLGELLLRTGKTERAIPHLAKAVELQPNMAQIRALYARALKQTGRYEEAADQFATMVATAPDGGGRWQRYAAGALSQAGRREEAADMFDAWVASRAHGLPDSFAEGLEALWGKIDGLKIPQARLDWAWSLRGPDCTLDRAEWERRAKWGHLADHYLLDWLECRDAQVEEAMYHFADELDFLETFCAEARARAPGKGVVYASAHVGAMYFGPLALELVGERSRWLASTPSVARTSYADSLISTSDQTDAQVARAFMQSLKQDNIVVVVVDGAINLAAPRIEFEEQEVTFSEFAARMAHRTGSSSAFVAPVWRESGHLGFVLEHLPMPEEGEDADAYAARWRDAYLGHLRAFLAGRPENLRLSGGIWRHIR